MKAKTKKITAISLGLVMGTSTFATVLQADTITKTLKATYNNIKVTFNGDYKQPANEPFLINGAVYVSLRDAGQMTGNAVNWDSSSKTVQISNSNTGNSVSATELANKNLEIANLKSQVNQLQEKLDKVEKEEVKVEDAHLTESAIKETLDELKDDYDNKYKIRWDLDLEEKKGNLVLTATFDSRRYDSEFEKLDEDDLEDFMEDMSKDIAAYHKGVKIEGTIYDKHEREDILTSTYDAKGNFSADTKTTTYTLNNYAKTLKSRYRRFPTLNFEGLTGNISVDSIQLDMNSRQDNITFLIGVKLSADEKSSWIKMVNAVNDNYSVFKKSKLDTLENQLYDIADDILDEFDIDTVSGAIYDISNTSSDDISDGNLLANFEDDTLEIR